MSKLMSMDPEVILECLNSAQKRAVTCPSSSVLVLAGAGSGKTRVLVHRLAWLAGVEGISLQGILAVTFTNKASNEMRGRIETLLGVSSRSLWVGTFHGLAHRFLRHHAQEAGLIDTFQILDSDDQHRLVRRLVRNLGLEEARWPPRLVQGYINSHKEHGRRARHLQETPEPFEQQLRLLYLAYEDQCERSGLVDFAELLLRSYELFRNFPEILKHYQERFRHVLVDEFQDTNQIQYAWLRLLTASRQNLFAVGDDDQSIYSWRGARVENLQKFQQDFPDHQLIRLEQNYRSTATILDAANALIAQNQNRIGKTLWTDGQRGELISLYSAFNEQEEAYFVAERIKQCVHDGNARREVAILYRSNAQSRQFEEKFVALGIPYRVYGGLRFFERAEIKDAVAYLRLLLNRNDDASFERVVNTPARGVGTKTLDTVRTLARSERISLWSAACLICRDRFMISRGCGALQGFMGLIDALEDECYGIGLSDKIRLVIMRTGLGSRLTKEFGEHAEARLENLKELVNAARQFEGEPNLDSDVPVIDQFLAHAALEGGENQHDGELDCVQLMTLHAAKGLEFEIVFLVGLEEGLFPSLQSLSDGGRLEEERRLCYVGMTRARHKLCISYAETRRIYGKENYPRPSRFLREIPPEYVQEVRLRGAASRPKVTTDPKTEAGIGLRLGQRVRHARFGEGIILQHEGDGEQCRVQVHFEEVGDKWLMLAFADLQAS